MSVRIVVQTDSLGLIKIIANQNGITVSKDEEVGVICKGKSVNFDGETLAVYGDDGVSQNFLAENPVIKDFQIT